MDLLPISETGWSGRAYRRLSDQGDGTISPYARFASSANHSMYEAAYAISPRASASGLGMLMGHRGIATLLNTYFHASSLVIAERCGYWQPSGSLSDARLGALVGRERSRITKLRLRLPTPGTEGKAGWHEVVQHLTQESGKSSAGSARATKKQHSQDDSAEPDSAEPAWESSWVLVVRMLVHRLESNSSLEEMTTFATEDLGMPLEMASRISVRYQELVIKTGLDDFEPIDSTLIRPVASHQRGVSRGRLERDRFLARVQKWLESRPADHEMFDRFMRRWEERVDASSPRVACVNQNELDETVSILTSLGAEPSQLIFETHGDRIDRWLEEVVLSHPVAKQSTHRASRGNSKVLVKEVSILIGQQAGQRFPDGRDLHRALIAVYVAWSTLLQAGQSGALR